jgi:DNA polymerase III delta prime subunit
MSSSTRSFFQFVFTPFQMFFWLIFHPSAWRNYIHQIDPNLSPDFALADLANHSSPSPELKRLWRAIFLIQPILMAIVIAIVLLTINLVPRMIEAFPIMPTSLETLEPATKINPFENFISIGHLILGISYGVMLYLVGTLISSFTISFAFGIVSGTLGGFLTGILFGLAGTTAEPAGIGLGIFIMSLAGSILASLSQDHKKWPILRQFVGVIIGLTISGIVLLLGSFLGATFGDLLILLAPSVQLTIPQAQIIGMAAAAGLIIGWRFQDRRWMPTLALLFASIIWLLISLIFNIVNKIDTEYTLLEPLLSGLTGGTVNAILFSVLFTLPYLFANLLARYIADVWAGILAGILGSGSAYLLFAILLNPNQFIWLIGSGLLSMLLGLSYRKWLPILLYPFTAAWNGLLLRAQRQQPEQSVQLLQQHSVFWDEHQYLPLWGLEKQLINVYQHDQNAGKAAMNELSASAQNWAVQAAYLELDIQSLMACQNIYQIAEVHESLLNSEKVIGATGPWLKNFRETSHEIEIALSQQGPNQQHQTLKNVISGLKGSLVNPEASGEIQRFQKIASNWLKISQAFADELLHQQDIPNPYTFGPPLDKKVHDVFADRPEVTTRLEQLLQTRHCPPLLLYGQRRTGKTTLLKNLDILLPKSFVMLFVDCQGPLAWTQDHASFFYQLARNIAEAATHYPDLTFPPLDEAQLRSDPFTRFDDWLNQLEESTGDKTLLLALDEFVTLNEGFSDKRLQPAGILGMFRHIIQHRPRFRLLFGGTHTFSELQHWASYMINVQTVHISYLSENDARQLIEEPVKYYPLRYTPEASQRVLTATHAHPALVQLLCGEIVQLKNKQGMNQRLKVQIEEVETGIANALKFGSFFFADIEQNQVDDTGRAVLRFIAAQGEGAIVTQENLSAQITGDLKNTIALLLQRELIEEVDDKGYRYQVEMIRRWFV